MTSHKPFFNQLERVTSEKEEKFDNVKGKERENQDQKKKFKVMKKSWLEKIID